MNGVLYDVADLLGPTRRNVEHMAETIEAVYPDWIDRITTRDIREYLKVVK